MKQEIQIAVSNENDLIGTFIISTEITNTNIVNNIPNNNVLLEEAYADSNYNTTDIILENINIVEEIDDKTPIEYCNKDNDINIFLLEEQEYDVHFVPQINKDISVFTELDSHNNNEFYKKSTKYDGFLRAKSYVGKTFLDLPDFNFKIPIEIKSKKINYDIDYRNMIGDLAQFTSGLLFNMNAPLYQSYEKSLIPRETYYETFLLIEYIFKDKNLPSVFEYLSRNLYSSLETYVDNIPTDYAKDISSNELIDIVFNPQNMVSTEHHSMFSINGKNYIPLMINELKHEETIDVPENRFYKYFLEYLDSKIKELLEMIQEDGKTDSYMFKELDDYKKLTSYFLSQKYFRDVSNMDFAPLNSQVLQKKEGYREILEYYLLFDYGLRIQWDELINEFMVYQKKVSTLYEYWIYFKLVECIKDFTHSQINSENIIKKNNKRWSFNLKKGVTTKVSFENITRLEKEVGIELYYNKTFSKAEIEENENDDFIITHGNHSYSVRLIPDYTLAITIDETVYYLHFDAKYKSKVIDDSTDSFQNPDIEKMHSYKDGINNSYGSFVLYSGNDNPIIFSDTSEYDYFGVGAIPLNPSNTRESEEKIIRLIENYILDLIRLHNN